MNRDELRAYCLSHLAAVEDFPFGDDPAVFKVMGKMFALLPVGGGTISLKCDPTWAIILRETYPAVTPGYHLNKRHWNSVAIDDSISDSEVFEMIDHSYDLVVKSLTKAQRQALKK
ncbi:MAG TPA: MmcQ/YjbR family DNA-binding protein [Phototrophicaceae bacterium]|nr:MmcQ/YjbR family DNA-binding protein [Phototrophicaceae bacterium]